MRVPMSGGVKCCSLLSVGSDLRSFDLRSRFKWWWW